MKRAFIVLLCLCLLAAISPVYGAGSADKWDVLKKISHGKNTYSVMLNSETNEMEFWKEVREKNEKKVVYQSALGVGDKNTKAKIRIKEEHITLILSGEMLSFLRLDEGTGEIEKKLEFPSKKKQKKKVSRSKDGKKAQSLIEETRPEAPTFLTITSFTSTTAQIKWNSVVGAKKYNIYIGDYYNHELIDETTATSYTVKNLEPDELYGIYVTAVHDEGESDIAPTAIETSDGEGIEDLSIKYDVGNIALNWNASANANKFNMNIYWILGDGKDIDKRYTTESNDFLFSDLDPLNFYVIDIGAFENSKYLNGAFIVVMTYPPVPEKPANLGYEIESDKLKLNWDKSHYATEYRVYKGTSQIGKVGTNQNSFEVEGLEEGKTYDFYVSAKSIAGTSEKAHIKVKFEADEDEIGTPPEIPDPPAPTGDLPPPDDFKEIKLGKDFVTLEWETSEEAKGYVLWVCRVDGQEQKTIGSNPDFPYMLSSLEPNTWYELHLRALDEEGKDGQSAILTIKTLPLPPDPPVVKVDKVTSISAFLSWKKPLRATKYKVLYEGDDRDQVYKKPQVKIINLKEEQEYVFKVVAMNRGGDSEPTVVKIKTIPLTFDYIYDGQLLDSIESSYEQLWNYSYDKNGNTKKVLYTPKPKSAEQEYDITLDTVKDNR